MHQNSPFLDFNDTMFEGANAPLSGIACQFQQCTVTIKSASLRITPALLSKPLRASSSSFQLSQFMVRVHTSEEPVEGRLSLVIHAVAKKPADDDQLSMCLQDSTFMQGDECITLFFERALRDSSPNSCYFTQIEPPIRI